jgi:acyl-ACP thioesterase
MLELVPLPDRGRTFTGRRPIGLADRDRHGRLRLDAVARFLQDVAIADVDETGWGLPDHLWFVRRIRIDVLEPCREDREVEVVTWCSGLAAVAAGRRWSLRGDRGGRIEVDSVWIHLGPDQLPARIEGFGVYAEATGGRRVSTRTDLAGPAENGHRLAWPLRATDVDVHGHVNNAVHWQAVEHVLAGGAGPDPSRPLTARLDYREPLDLTDEPELAWSAGDESLDLALLVEGRPRAVARVTPAGSAG